MGRRAEGESVPLAPAPTRVGVVALMVVMFECKAEVGKKPTPKREKPFLLRFV